MKSSSKRKHLPTDAIIKLSISVWGLVAGSPDGRVPKQVLEDELCLSDSQLEEIVFLLGTLTDTSTGAHLIISIDDDDVVLEGQSGHVPPFRLSDSGSILLENLISQGTFDEESSRRIIGALSSRSDKPVAENGVETTEFTGGPFFQTLYEARECGVRCRILYQSITNQDPRWRLIDPGFFFSENGRTYLAAWDIEQDAQKHYRLDRIRNVRMTDDSVERHRFEHVSIQQSLSEHGKEATIAVRDISYLERFEWTGTRLEDEPVTAELDGRMVYTVSYSSEQNLFDLILAGGGDTVLLSPHDLHERFLAYGRELLSNGERSVECRSAPDGVEDSRGTTAPGHA